MDTKAEMGPPSRAHRLSGKYTQFLAATVVSSLTFMYGMTISWTSPVQSLLQSDSSPVGRLTDEEMSWLASLIYVGGVAGTVTWSRVADRLGRKFGGYLVAGTFLLGWALTAFTSNRNLLFVARFLNGFAGTGGMIVAPTYISEIAQDRIRGSLGSFAMLYINAGVLGSYTLGALMSYQALNLACLAIPVFFFVAFLRIPESPEYLWSKNKKHSAHKSLLWLRGGDVKCAEEETLCYSGHNQLQQESVHYSALVSDKGRKKAMVIGLGLSTFQQMSGIVTIMSFTSFFFAKSGSSIPPDRATIIVGVIQLFASLVSSSIVDRCGRKLLLYISYLSMGVALTTLGVYFFLDGAKVDVSSFRWLPVLCLSFHVLNYALGAGPVPYIVISETVPIDIRGLAVSVLILWGTFLAFVNVKIFPFLVASTGFSGCLWLYATFSFLGFFFALAMVPETKGVPLQDILLQLRERTKDIV